MDLRKYTIPANGLHTDYGFLNNESPRACGGSTIIEKDSGTKCIYDDRRMFEVIANLGYEKLGHEVVSVNGLDVSTKPNSLGLSPSDHTPFIPPRFRPCFLSHAESHL